MRSYRTRAGRSVVRTTLFAGAVIAAILFAGDGPTFAAASGDAACAAAPARSSCPTPQRPRPALYGTQMYDANGRPLTRIPAQTRGSAAATTASPQVVRGPDF